MLKMKARSGWHMRRQVAGFMVEYYRWVMSQPENSWETDGRQAMRNVRLMWSEHLKKYPLPEYPAA